MSNFRIACRVDIIFLLLEIAYTYIDMDTLIFVVKRTYTKLSVMYDDEQRFSLSTLFVFVILQLNNQHLK